MEVLRPRGSWNLDRSVSRIISWIKIPYLVICEALCPPEMFNTPYFCCEEDNKFFSLAETIPGPTTDALSALARDTQTVIIATIFEKVTKGEYYDTAAVIGTDGSIIGKYR